MALLLPLLALLWLAGPTRAGPADPVWVDATGGPNASARDALRLLADAGADGLAPRDYQAAELAEQAAALAAAPGAAASRQPAFERDLEAAMRRYLHDLHLGRINPRALGFRVARPGAAAPDFAALLQAAAAAGRLPQVVAELRPRLGQYAKLREALARYRVLAADGSLGQLPFAAPVKPQYSSLNNLNRLIDVDWLHGLGVTRAKREVAHLSFNAPRIAPTASAGTCSCKISSNTRS